MAIAAYGSGNDNIVASSSYDTYTGGGGDDFYYIGEGLAPGNYTFRDGEGTNTIVLADGVSIESSIFVQGGARITLSDGNTFNITGDISHWQFAFGGNILAADPKAGASVLNFTDAAEELGVTLPLGNDLNAPAAHGGSGTVSANGFTGETTENIVDLTLVPEAVATNGADIFVYEYSSATDRAIGEDGEVSIVGFDAAHDSIRLVDTAGKITDIEGLATLGGFVVAPDPFNNATLLDFDPKANEAQVIELLGVQLTQSEITFDCVV
ncbi:hypothetical protein SAMN05421644_11050 [Allochromatium warmingii]|uniref:Uncharacterized protein n=1 Tax=Allochromatium warmingii TaxID=61595 RepID=A0A1H3DX28_ALLWA|nr:hypothetical protein [Allochromatium warmingii]SDX70941.1 hypothetical protein SAMN05421644_11050 [Allochromatium warmingii]